MILLEHIDAIARQKQRDVLFITFFTDENPFPDYKNLPIRSQIIEWLDDQKIDCMPCGEWADENSITSYRGTIYINIPYDEENQDFKKLQGYLEHPDGTMRYSAHFCVVSLSEAMKYAYHDEPGFWDEWAETF
jgi:hypothetical protein